MASNASNEFATISEIIKTARMNLTQGAWDYMAGASESETTMKRNRRALDRLALKPRAMRDVRDVDTSVTVMGMDFRIPALLAPIGSLETFCPAEGAIASARAAEEFGICHMLSSRCSPGSKRSRRRPTTTRSSSSTFAAARTSKTITPGARLPPGTTPSP